MAIDKKRYDIIALGATGFTGQYILSELVKVLSQNDKIAEWDSLKSKTIKLAIAGRNSVKMNDLVKQVLSENPNYVDSVDCLVIDLNDLENIASVTAQAKLLINAVGPYKLYGKRVVESCINTGTHYVDLTGEVSFIEEIYCEFNKDAQNKDLMVVNCCGFDSVPADLGNIMFKKYLIQKGLEPIAIDMYVKPNISNYKGAGNYTTFQSAIESITLGNPYRKKFKQLLPRPQTTVKPTPRPKYPTYDNKIQSYVAPFPMADGPVVTMTQSLIYKENQNEEPTYDKTILNLTPCNIGSYLQFYSVLYAVLAALIVIVTGIVLKLPFGKYIVLKYPHIFTLGLFQPLQVSNPSKHAVLNDSFEMSFISRNKKQASNSEVQVTAKFLGPEAGYNFTSKSVVFAALSILKEKVYDATLKLNGVLTPGLALSHTAFFDRLSTYDSNVKFVINE